jgi:hypothetical protein
MKFIFKASMVELNRFFYNVFWQWPAGWLGWLGGRLAGCAG